MSGVRDRGGAAGRDLKGWKGGYRKMAWGAVVGGGFGVQAVDRRRWRRDLGVLVHDRDGLLGIEGTAPADGLVDHDAERVDVARGGRAAAATLLGRHVERGAEEAAVGRHRGLI